MILGIGADLCSVTRIAGAIERRGQSFLDRLFSEAEQQRATTQRSRDAYYAGLFAAKEACLKALGTGVTERVRWTDVEIGACDTGEPRLKLSAGAYRRMRRLVGKANSERLHLSITVCGTWALANVILERHGGS